MEWVTDLRGKTVGLDTAPLIYFIEEHPDYLDAVRCFFEAMDKSEIVVVSSTVTILEVLVHPLRNSNNELAAEYRDILLHSNLITQEVSAVIAEEAARLRAFHNLRTPDSIQIATAMHLGATHFLTNDTRLLTLSSLKILVLDELIK